jgi:hypothetical protein
MPSSLENIEKFLHTHAIPESTELAQVLKQLFKIKRSVTRALRSYDRTFSSHLSEQQELIQKLAGRCHKLQERRAVINLAEAAEDLANNSPLKSDDEVSLAANELRNRIDAFVRAHRPSRDDAKFIRFARACIDKAEKHEPLLQKRASKAISLETARKNVAGPESTEVAEALYELAGLLYQEKMTEFHTSLSHFAPATQKEIHYHISVCKGHLDLLSKKEERLKVIQGILGYAHLLADYYMDNTPYPTIVEIHHLFQDLEMVHYLEGQESQLPSIL